MKADRRFPIPPPLSHTVGFRNGLLVLLVSQSFVVQVVLSGSICHIELQRNFTVQEPPPMIPIQTYSINTADCGQHGSLPATKQETRLKREQAPWMVLLVIRAKHGSYSYCSGTVITQRHVLTAARCTTYSPVDPLATIEVHYGAKGAVIEAARFLRHPKFDVDTLLNDIAILMVDKCLEDAKPICLPTSPVNLGQSSPLEFAWEVQNKRNPDGRTMQLLGSTLDLMPAGTCGRRLKDSINEKLFFCGVGTLTCQLTDISVPAFTRRSDGRMVQVGIASYGENCRSRFGVQVFTRVDHYMAWIKENLDRYEKYEPLALSVV